jgi:glycosyltransferase involved in cell wall biosynthesis/2-polyprenyl-3-methyl-5-hydroxy-6-metoxy-1,4-benzoquinol methylase
MERIISVLMTHGMSLVRWKELGLLDRELSLYTELYNKYQIVTQLITYGGKEDIGIANDFPGIRVLCNTENIPITTYTRWLPWLHYHSLLQSFLIKTHQIKGAEVANEIAMITKLPVIIRCGYIPSDLYKHSNPVIASTVQEATIQENNIFPFAEYIVVTTEHMRQYIVENYNIQEDTIHVIPNFVNTESFAPFLNFNKSEKKQIIFVGRLSHQKNLVNLLKACENIDSELVLIGSGELQSELERLAENLHVKLRIISNVPNEVLPSYLNAANLFVLLSPHEGHPKALIEAMSCGLPVLGANSPGIKEIITHGVNGILCETDVENVHEAIISMLNDEPLCERIGKEARDYVVEHFSLSKIVETEYQFYCQYLNINNRKPSCHVNIFYWCKFGLIIIMAKIKAVFPMKKVIQFFKFQFISLLATISSVWISKSMFLKTLSQNHPDKFSILAMNIINNLPVTDKTISQTMVVNYIQHYLASVSPEAGLKFLLELDNWLYKQEGQSSIAYNNGLHVKHRLINYYRFFTENISTGNSVLDIGCGNGALTFQIAKKTCAPVLGIDISKANIDTAKLNFAAGNITYRFGDITTDLPNEHFDVVVMSNVLEHLENRVEILKLINNEIKPNKLLLRVPMFERDWRVPLKKELNVDWRMDNTHYIEYTLNEFIKETSVAGYSIVYQEIHWGEFWAVLVIGNNAQ